MRRFEIHEDADAIAKFVERIDAESEFHASFRAELIDEDLRAGMVFDVLKEKCGAARS